MKRQSFLLIALLCFAFTAHAQLKLTEFEKELIEFRYSFYEALDSIPFEQLRKMDFTSYKGFGDKFEEFMEVYAQDIHKYKMDILNMYSEFPLPDLQGYHPIINKEEIDEVNSSLVNELEGIQAIYYFMSMDMRAAISLSLSMYNARLGPEQLSAESIINIIAAYRISTRQKDNDNWQIVVDRHKLIYEFRYSFKDNFLYLENVYEKNGTGN